MAQRILVVSDDQDTRTLLVKALSNEGFQVFAIPNEEETLLQFGLIQPVVTIVDIIPNGRYRWTTLRRIRELFSAPVIALTVCEDSSLLVESLEQGADYSMPKPFSVRELQARVRALLRRAQCLAPCIV